MNKKLVFSIIIFMVLIVAIVVGTYLVSQNQDIREKAAALTNLSFSPASQSIIKDQSFNLVAKMNSATNLVTGIDIEIAYNPSAIKINQVTPTSALSNLTYVIQDQTYIDNALGKARYVAFTPDKTKYVSGSVNLLTISGTVLSSASAGTYQITYSNVTAIAAVNESQNTLLSKSSASIIVANSIPTATATPTETATPTATATAISLVGDVNKDGHVNMVDIGLVVDDYDSTSPVTPGSDVDKNGKVNIVDIGLIIDNYGR